MKSRSVALVSWAILGVPLMLGTITYVIERLKCSFDYAPEPGLVVWISALVLGMWSGAKAIFKCLPGLALRKTIVVFAYVACMYVAITSITFVVLFAQECPDEARLPFKKLTLSD